MMIWFLVVGVVVALATADLRREPQALGIGMKGPAGRVRRSDAALMRTLRGLHMEEWEPPGTLGAIAASQPAVSVTTPVASVVPERAQEVGASGVLKPRVGDRAVERVVVKREEPVHALLSVRIGGEVHAPGLLRVQEGTPVLAALMQAGGTTGKGSLRRIFLKRLLKERELDMYQGLVDGPDASIVLADGDEIRVPEGGPSVTLGGKVKRPGTFELVAGDTAAKLVGYAGGVVDGGAKVVLTRKSGKSSSGTLADAAKWGKLAAGDKIDVR